MRFCHTRFILAALTHLVGFTASRRINIGTTLSRNSLSDSFVQCWVKSCDADDYFLQLPEFECNLKENEEFPKETFRAFVEYLNGGKLERGSRPLRPLLLDVKEELACPSNAANHMGLKENFKAVRVHLQVALMLESTCFLMQLPAGPVICGCLSNHPLANGTLPSIATKDVKDHLPKTCEIYLMPHSRVEQRPPKPRVHAALGKQTLCVASWNVGREWDKLAEMGIGSGMGLSGLQGPELTAGIKTLLDDCGDASIVALGIQEGADPMITQNLKDLAADGPRKVIANAFAGVRPWGRNIQKEGGVQGLSEHEARVIKEGLFGTRDWVVLTTENLLIFKYDTETKSISGARPAAFQLDAPGFFVSELQGSDLLVNGVQFKEGDKSALSCENIERSLFARSVASRNDWALAIRLQSIRARGEMVKEGEMSLHTNEGNSSVTLPHRILLTTAALYPVVLDPETGDPKPRIMDAISLGNPEFRVIAEGDRCLQVSGIHFYHLIGSSGVTRNDGLKLNKPLRQVLKLCATRTEERDKWLSAMQQASLARAAWEVAPPYLIKSGVLSKVGQVFGIHKNRLVYLTQYHLSTYDFVESPGQNAPVGEATNSLALPTVVVLKDDEKHCMWVYGIETRLKGKINDLIKYKMCAETGKQIDVWIDAIRTEVERSKAPRIYDGYEEDSVDDDGMTTALTLRLQVVGTLNHTNLQDIITKGIVKIFPGMTEAQTVDIYEACRNVDGSFRPAWSVKMNLLNVKIKPGRDLQSILDGKLQALGFRIVDSEISVFLRENQFRSFVDEEKDTLDKLAFLPFTNGVSIAVLSDTPASEIQLYTVDFAFASKKGRKHGWFDQLKEGMRKYLPTTADKGGAIVRAVIQDRAYCFAACHLEANKAEKRHLQAQLMSDSLASISCDAIVWMGDFNTRPKTCCPWREIELAVAHDLRQHVRNSMWNHDDFPEMVNGYEEMAPLYRPTFHKRFRREGHNECDEKEFVDVVAPNPFHAHLASRNSVLSNASTSDEEVLTSALLAANRKVFNQGCDGPAKATRNTLCWGGDHLRESCETGRCFNTVDKSHCPGYTDRIIYKGNVLSPLSYWPVENLVEADHTPVVATFQLQLT